MGFLPELKINGKQFAQLTPMLVYLSQIGKMDRLDPMEEFKSGMMIQTATDVFVGSEGFQLDFCIIALILLGPKSLRILTIKSQLKRIM